MVDMSVVENRLAQRLAELRKQRGWSLDELARVSGVSRPTLSRLERGEVSPTAQVLVRLAAAFGITMSRLLAEVEGQGAALVRAAHQPVWTDPETGFRRRGVSPPAPGLAAEMIDGELPARAEIRYPASPRPGLEHHLYLLAGGLEMEVEGQVHRLAAGDALRWRLYGASRFLSLGPAPARYVLALV
ncbi:helix-turn-helix domain-containing protein [Phenylobacterium sp.]|jgi:transcriptional regulator with XRE-family HTH domain|uniref:helix-turn-helix domain-containing protein n=1 Tax=Phenylobacterium sp. TaxID=1871053 RepID=UPI002E302C06|nr:helix-turn-helix domain-containing protein [Phenylobacterium sp.]HEX2561792.1 helix-turn-helix domain-containing protein [Phenylobacterium sp.]